MDKTAAWDYSRYHGWVYRYRLHLTCTRDGFPVLFDVRTANVNERQVLDKKQARLVARGVPCIIADKGYTDGARAAAFGAANVVLLTPALSWEQAHTQLGPDALLHPLEVEGIYPASGEHTHKLASVSADGDGAGVQFVVAAVRDKRIAQTVTGAGYWVCVDVLRTTPAALACKACP